MRFSGLPSKYPVVFCNEAAGLRSNTTTPDYWSVQRMDQTSLVRSSCVAFAMQSLFEN